MNLTRLMILGTLAAHGPRHGHEIKRIAETMNVGTWGGVSVGALYREIREMEAVQMLTPVRTEQVGRRPARTIYALTDEGRRELAVQRDLALRAVHPGPDPLAVALTFARAGADRADMLSALQARRENYACAAASLKEKREFLVEKGYADAELAAVLYRAQLLAETEVRWHDEFAQIVGAA
jgi:DNA-binding PadR family transcriptional regulator